MSLKTEQTIALVALVGNPNIGKTTVFNRLTGLRQRVGNYPGVTVEKKSGILAIAEREIEILDLPGMYSLAARSPDERVVLDALSGIITRKPDLVVCVLDASNLKRNLFLASQIAELELPMVLVLNQWDVAKRNGLEIDLDTLERQANVRVVPLVASKGEGIPRLRELIKEALSAPRLMRRIAWPAVVRNARNTLCNHVGANLSESDALRMLFDTDSAVADRVLHGRNGHESVVKQAREELVLARLNPGSAEAVLHYRHLDGVLEGVMRQTNLATPATTESIDKLLLHRVWGSLIFVAIMWVVFQSVYAWAGPLMDLIEAGTGWVQGLVAPSLARMPVMQSLVVDGIMAGAGGVVIFLPQIFILFLFIGLLEDTGYMARAAFLMDKLFGWCGLNGRSFVPMLSSFACAIPGVMAARTIADPKARLTTVLMAPFMSCSARLPVYVLLIGAFIEPLYGAAAAGWVLFAMHFVGLAAALPLAWVLNRLVLKLKPLPFILEMPPYKTPMLRDLFLRMWEGGREFLIRAGTVIMAFSVILWALLYFPRDPAVEQTTTSEFIEQTAAASGSSTAEVYVQLADEDSALANVLANQIQGAYVDQSYLGRFGRVVQPLFAPAGFDWKITVGVLSSFPAREVIIATLGIIYHLGADVDEESESLAAIMAAERWPSGPRAGEPVFTVPVVVAIMVFFALCMQCGATVAVIKKELNWRWAAGAFLGMSVLAWMGAVVVYQIGTALS